MQPLTILTGIILGSVASIAFGLAVSVLVSVFVGRDAPQLAAELGALWRHTLVFSVLTAVCALAFLGLVKRTPWRWYAQSVMWLALAVVVYAYWPQ